ncbi:exodeoxyribonuclease V subunit gamma [Nitriliruptoraceae bacterium ZYF776]|nr:exodeoxyribonuclease V subunit gamma [Profundirhabdus halotolerans]
MGPPGPTARGNAPVPCAADGGEAAAERGDRGGRPVADPPRCCPGGHLAGGVTGGRHTARPTGGPRLLHVHHADRADHLVGVLADVLATPPSDVFAREVVAVHSRGIERWVSQRLAHHLGATHGAGIAANLDFPFPGRLVADAVAIASGTPPDEDPWRPQRLTWPLLEVTDRLHREGRAAALGPLVHHLATADGGPSPRRLGAVRRVADLFDRYAVHRPEQVLAWSEGADVGPDGRALPERHAWQPLLWRELRGHLGDHASVPERLRDAVATLRRGHRADGRPLDLDLPDRLAVFGVTALPVTTVQLLAALAEGPTPTAPAGRDVHLFLLHPSPALWERVDRHLDGEVGALPVREEDPTRELASHPLLAGWGRDARELQLVVRHAAARSDLAAGVAVRTDGDRDGDRDGVSEPPTLLARLQAAVRADAPPWSPGAPDDRPVLATDDRSVQVHRCHGPRRQVEVLRDVLLGVLADHPDLEPRDVVVLCPDIETFAPMIRAVFGAAAVDGNDDPDRTGDLRVQLADRALRRTNPVLRVVAEVLELADDRCTASSVLDLVTRGPVRRRFGFDDHDLERLEERIEGTGIRWGLDADHRAAFDVPTDANTWRVGLDRLLVGVAVDDRLLRTVGGLPPAEDVEGDDVELVGRLAELVDRLGTLLDLLRGPHPLPVWLDLLEDVADLLCAVDPTEAWQRSQLGELRADLLDAVAGAELAAALPLTLTELRDLLADRLAGAPSRASHRTGDLTVCTLVPMRSVPHEVVVLLGMDDEVFPRRTVPDGDDLLAAAPRVGDRDARSEDRQLLLDALLAAGRCLVVLTTGRDERTNDVRPPAVPIGELLDVVDHTVRSEETRPDLRASQLVTVEHPLQPFDPATFRPGGTGHPDHPAAPADGPFGFDRHGLRGAEVRTRIPQEPGPFLAAALPPLDPGRPVRLRELSDAIVDPCGALLHDRLQLRDARGTSQVPDTIPTELPGGLERWEVGQRLLETAIAGLAEDRAVALERQRGLLPPGALADEPLEGVLATVRWIVAGLAHFGVDVATPGRAVEVDVTLPTGRRVVGVVDDVVDTTRRRIAFSRLGPRHRLAAWIDVLALTAQDPTRPWSAVTLHNARKGLSRRKDGPAVVSVSTIGGRAQVGHSFNRRTVHVDCRLGDPTATPDERRACAVEQLELLVDLRDRALTDALPLPCDTAAAYAHRAWLDELGLLGASHAGATDAGRTAWETGDFASYPNDDRHPPHRRLLGDLTFAELAALPAREDEVGDGWFDRREPGRFGRLARRLWFPLLAEEQLEDWYRS